MKRFLWILATFLVFGQIAYGDPYDDSHLSFDKIERQDRVTDEAALSSKISAIKSFERLLKNPNHEDRRALVMLRLAESLQQAAEMDYRIKASHKPAASAKVTSTVRDEVSPYMARSLDVLQELERIPHQTVDEGRIHFLKAVALRELGKRPEAIAEFTLFIRDYPKREESYQARFSLAQLERDAKDYPAALAALNGFRMPESSPYEAYRLEMIFGTQMDAEDIGGAAKTVDLESARLKKLGRSARMTELEKAYEHAIRAYLRGIETKTPGTSLDRLYAVLKGMNSGATLGKPLLEVAESLRVKDWREPLSDWRQLLQASESRRPEWKEILWICAEYELNNGRTAEFAKLFAQLRTALQQPHTKVDPGFREKVESFLIEKSIFLASRIKSIADPASGKLVRKDLNIVYQSFIAFASPGHPKMEEVRFNLAENAFKTEDFAVSTLNYLWLIHWRANEHKAAEVSTVKEVSTPTLILKAVASRYEEFRADGRLPKDLAARPLNSESHQAVEPQLAAWLSWIDRLRLHESRGDGVPPQTLDSFEYEANRVLYGEGHLRAAVERMSAFGRRDAKSAYAVSASTLVVDTYVLSKDWTNARASALLLHDVLPDKEKALSNRLSEIASEATYQIAAKAYNEKDYGRVLFETDLALKTLPRLSREKDTVSLAVQAATAQKDGTKMRAYTDILINRYSQSPEGIDAFRLRAAFDEEDLDYASASQDLRRYLISQVASKSGDVNESVEIRRKSLFLAWLSGDAAELRKTLDFSLICDKHLRDDCELYRGLLLLADGKNSDESADTAKDRALYGPVNNRAVWAVAYLVSDPAVPSERKFPLIEALANGWSKIDPLIQFSIYPDALKAVSDVMEQKRREVAAAAPVQTQPSWIRNRTGLLEDLEKKAEIAIQMPWARIQVSAIATVASAYMDFYRDIEKFQGTFSGLSDEDRKAVDASMNELKESIHSKISGQARRGLTVASAAGVEESETLRLVKVLTQFKADRAEFTMPPADIAGVERLKSSFMIEAEGDSDWNPGNISNADPVQKLKRLWSTAIDRGAWVQAAYLLKVAKDQHLFSEYTLGRAQAVFFDALGARSEGLPQFEYGMDQLATEHAQQPLTYMLALSVYSLSKEKTTRYLGLIEQYWRKGAKYSFRPDEARLLLYAAQWVGYSLPSRMNEHLVALSKQEVGKGRT